MRVDVTPRRADILAGQPLPLAITIANTSTVIGGYAIRVLGADPGWVQLETDQVSLFPDESRTVQAVLTPPQGVASGARRIAVQVRQLNPPQTSTIVELDLTVPSARAVRMRVDPLTVTAGRRAAYSVIVENTGNTVVNGRLAGEDPENKVRFAFAPEALTLSPGEHAVVDLRARAHRHLVGSPVVRPLALFLDETDPESFFDLPAGAEPTGEDHGPGSSRPAGRGDESPLATATFLQKAMLARGALSLLGLLAAATVFALILTVALTRLVGQSTADRDLALKVAEAANSSGGSGGTSGVSGTVRKLTSGTPVSAVSVSVYPAADTSSPVATTATGSDGTYRVTNLAAGKYKISFRGAGFIQLWYPNATSDANAATVTLAAKQLQSGLDVTLGGIPASIGGTVLGDDVAGATVYLTTASGTGATAGTVSPAAERAAPIPGLASATPTAPNGGAIVTSAPVGTDGTFTLADVPSPSVYDLVVSKAGYATSTQRIDVGAGEARSGVQLRLSKGDGVISGTVNSPTGPLGGVTITALAGQSSVNTVSLTVGQVGAFTLRNLPTPASFTVTASKPGFAAQTLTLTLTAGQKLRGVAITLSSASASLHGAVSALGSGAPGVTVSATNGQLSVSTVTETTPDPGNWTLGGLPAPGTYTVTFSRADLAAQTVSIGIDAAGAITAGSQVAQVDAHGDIRTTLHSATRDVTGTVTQAGASGCGSGPQLGEAQVTLTSGTSSYTTTTASAPSTACGRYYLDRIPPGTYTLTVSAGTGTSPASQVVTLTAGDTPQEADVKLPAPASLAGSIQASTGGAAVSSCGWTVQLYVQAQYPTVLYRSATTSCASGAQNGTFRFAGVPAGSYVVEVHQTPGSEALASTVVTVAPSQAASTGVIKVSVGD